MIAMNRSVRPVVWIASLTTSHMRQPPVPVAFEGLTPLQAPAMTEGCAVRKRPFERPPRRDPSPQAACVRYSRPVSMFHEYRLRYSSGMGKIGYARVSTKSQNDDSQV